MERSKQITKVLDDPDFKELMRRKNAVSLTLTIVMLVMYFGFIILIAYYKPFMSIKVSGAIPIGIPIAMGVIVFSWVLTGVYVMWANSNYDNLVRKVIAKVGN